VLKYARALSIEHPVNLFSEFTRTVFILETVVYKVQKAKVYEFFAISYE